jgi:hypothetical protein
MGPQYNLENNTAAVKISVKNINKKKKIIIIIFDFFLFANSGIRP